MSKKQYVTFSKLLLLLLLVSVSVAAKTAVPQKQLPKTDTTSLTKTTHSLHHNMLQPQVVHVSVTSEQPVKPVLSDYVAWFYGNSIVLTGQPKAQTRVFLQDADRCESVSRLLFPFHSFW